MRQATAWVPGSAQDGRDTNENMSEETINFQTTHMNLAKYMNTVKK